jgi:hypothetical protein
LSAEAVTAATDYLLAVAALAGAVSLARRAGRRRSVAFWAGGFAAVGAAAVVGGTWHALSPRLGATPADALWKITLAATGLAGGLLIAGAAHASVRRHTANWVVGAAAAKLGVFLFLALPGDSFDPVIVDSAVTMGTILGLQGLASATFGARSAPWVIAGVVVSAAAAAVEAFRPRLLPNPWSPDAVYHLVEIAGLFLFYRGGLLFADR